MRRAAASLAFGLAVLLAGAGVARADFESAKKMFLDGLSSPDWKARRNGVLALGEHDNGQAARMLLARVGDEKNPVVLAALADALKAYKSAGAQEALVDSAKRGKGTERTVAVAALAPNRSGEVDALLLDALEGGGPAGAQAALGLAVAGRGPRAVEALVKSLQHEQPGIRAAAARALALAKASDAVKPLAARLPNERGAARGEVVRALEALTSKKLGDAPAKWAAVAEGKDPSSVTEAPARRTTFFGIPVYGERVAFVLDKSVSMDDPHPFQGLEGRDRLEAICTPPEGGRIRWRRIRSKMQLAAAHLLHALDGLPTGTKVEVVQFAKEAEGMFGLRWSGVGAAALKTATTSFEEMVVGDGVNLYAAMEAALALGGPEDSHAWKNGPEEVFVITGDAPNLGDVKESDPLGQGFGAKAALRSVRVHVVGIGDHASSFARAATARSGGTYVSLSP